MNKTIARFTTKAMLLAGTGVLLAACGTASGVSPGTSGARIDSALQRAASNAAASGQRRQSLSYLEKIYIRNNTDPKAAVDYATALREEGYLTQAQTVLAPFADSADSPTEARAEYAALQLALGDYEMAEKYANKAVAQDSKNPRAYHYLGIALDSRRKHEDAEPAFRKAMEYWEGDPTPIMNNLALNLASQEKFEEATEILRKAKEMSPNKIEIERNLRIVTALQQSASIPVPKPPEKPAIKPAKIDSEAQTTVPESNS